MARKKKGTPNVAPAPRLTTFIVQDMVPKPVQLRLGNDMSTLGDLRNKIEELWEAPHWMQRLTTYTLDGDQVGWKDSPDDTPLTVVLAGLGTDDPVISLNLPGENDYVDIANVDDPCEYVMKDDIHAYQQARGEAGAAVKFILFSEYKRLAIDAVEQYLEYKEDTTSAREPERQRQRQE